MTIIEYVKTSPPELVQLMHKLVHAQIKLWDTQTEIEKLVTCELKSHALSPYRNVVEELASMCNESGKELPDVLLIQGLCSMLDTPDDQKE